MLSRRLAGYGVQMAQERGWPMAGFIKSVLVFVLLVTVLKGLIDNGSFKMYFKFASGLMLILLMASPLVNFLSGGSSWYKKLDNEIFNSGLKEAGDGLGIAEGKFEEIIREECKEDIKKQIIKMAEERGISVADIDIGLDNNSSSIQIAYVDININTDTNADGKNDLKKDQEETGPEGKDQEGTGQETEVIEPVDIQTVTVLPGPGDNAAKDGSQKKNNDGRKQVAGRKARKLKSDISSYFLVKEAAVSIWE